MLALWLFQKFQLSISTVGTIFFWTGIFSALSYLAAIRFPTEHIVLRLVAGYRRRAKIIYDLRSLRMFRTVKPPEEGHLKDQENLWVNPAMNAQPVAQLGPTGNNGTYPEPEVP